MCPIKKGYANHSFFKKSLKEKEKTKVKSHFLVEQSNNNNNIALF